MDAVTVNNISTETFADVVKNGAKLVAGTGCAIVPEVYLKIVDEYTDWQIEQETAKRLKEPDTKYFTMEEVMKEFGITEDDLAAAGDVEFE
ncbi:MAG: hypothetical protein SPL45_02035 [Schwartzia succinivorans]|nr:hypothetical protein [Schwartzia succinivorans]